MRPETETETDTEPEVIALLRELERLHTEVAVLRDCNASLARQRDDVTWRFEVARRFEGYRPGSLHSTEDNSDQALNQGKTTLRRRRRGHQ